MAEPWRLAPSPLYPTNEALFEKMKVWRKAALNSGSSTFNDAVNYICHTHGIAPGATYPGWSDGE